MENGVCICITRVLCDTLGDEYIFEANTLDINPLQGSVLLLEADEWEDGIVET